MPMRWSKDNAKTLINAAVGEQDVTSIELHDLDCPPEAANELIDLLG